MAVLELGSPLVTASLRVQRVEVSKIVADEDSLALNVDGDARVRMRFGVCPQEFLSGPRVERHECAEGTPPVPSAASHRMRIFRLGCAFRTGASGMP